MQASNIYTPRAAWPTVLARATAAILLFEFVSGLAITLGPFHPALEWGLIFHTVAGLIAIAPLAVYFKRHFDDYSRQALSDVLLLGYIGLLALFICVLSGTVVTAQAVFATRTAPWLRYTHLISTLFALVASVPHIIIAWLRRRQTALSAGAKGWLGYAVVTTFVSLVDRGGHHGLFRNEVSERVSPRL